MDEFEIKEDRLENDAEEGVLATSISNSKDIRASAAEYLIYVAATGDSQNSIEMRYEDENIWLTQKMIAALYDVDVRTISEHIKHIYDDLELTEEATIRKFRIVQNEGSRQVSAEQARLHAESEFEKYRIVQDKLFVSDYDKFLMEFEQSVAHQERKTNP